MNFEILKRNKIFNVKIGSIMRLVFKYSIFSSILLLGLSQIACADIRVPASLAAKKARDKKAAEERRKRLQPPANVSNYVLQSNPNGITLTWTNPTDSDFSKVLILKHTSPIVDSPTTGQDYAGVTSIGGSQMMYNAVRSSFTDTEITEGVTYFYKIFSYDTLLNYASGVELAVDRMPPANVTNHTLQSISNGITLTWSNPADSDFSKVLILKNTSPIVNSPATGRDYASGTSIGSSQVVYNGNLETLTITDNTANVIYYYKIFAYDTSFNYASGVELSGRRNADSDGDGLIEIYTAEMLNKIRHDLAGTSYKTSATQTTGNTDGCPASGCNGYELTADIDLLSLLDTNSNGMIDTTMEGIDKNADGDTTDAGEQITVIDTQMGEDTSWMPIGDNSTNDDTTRFTGIFEGNNHTIANLWVNITSTSDIYAGLFGVTGGTTVTIRNVGVISGSVHSSTSSSPSFSGAYSGGLVGRSSASLTITNSYFGGSGGISASATGTIDSKSSSGGLVGTFGGALTIIKSAFNGSGGVSSSTIGSSSVGDSTSSSGGLVGLSGNLVIINSYFNGSGGVSASAAASNAHSGGLVGWLGSSVKVMNSYFSGFGGVSSAAIHSISGGLVGHSHPSGTTLEITNCYFSGLGGVSSSHVSSSGSSRSGGLVGNSTAPLIIKNCIFSGSGNILSSSTSGGLIGGSTSSLTITNSYWNTNAPQSVNNIAQNSRAQGNAAMNPSGTTGLTLVQLQAITGIHPSGLPNSATDNTKAWDLGTDMQLPAVKLCIPTITNNVADWTMCASYGNLLPGQR